MTKDVGPKLPTSCSDKKSIYFMQRFRSANIVSLKTAHVGGKMKYLKDKKAVVKGYFVIVSQYRQNFKSVSFLMIHNLQGSK